MKVKRGSHERVYVKGSVTEHERSGPGTDGGTVPLNSDTGSTVRSPGLVNPFW